MTGSLLAPQGIGSLLPRLVTGKLTDRISSCPIILLGLLITALDTLPFAWATRSTIQIIQQVGGSFGTAILIILLTRAFFTLTQAFDVAFWWSIGFTLLALDRLYYCLGQSRL
jgi:hypothetical protein